MFGAWGKLCYDAAMLALESQAVIGLRLARLAGGGTAAQAEMQRMVSEKVYAAGETLVLLATGGSTAEVVDGYRQKVHQNWQRLQRVPAGY